MVGFLEGVSQAVGGRRAESRLCVQTTFHNALDGRCLFPARAFLVAHLREPLARLKSVFWYKGPGGLSALHSANGCGKVSVECWRAWLGCGDRQPAYFQEEDYFSNPYVRAFGMRSPADGDACDSWPAGDACAACAATKAECRVPGPVLHRDLLARCPHSARLAPASREDLAAARETLSRFDAVVVMEAFDEDAESYLLSKLGFGAIDAAEVQVLIRGRAPKEPTMVVNKNGRKAHMTPVDQDPPAELRGQILADQWLDIELYCEADARWRRDLGAWRNATPPPRDCAARLAATYGPAGAVARAAAPETREGALGACPASANASLCCTHGADRKRPPNKCHPGARS